MCKLTAIGSGGSRDRGMKRDGPEIGQPQPTKQSKIDDLIGPGRTRNISQESVNKLVQNYIVQGLHSFRTVERAEFKNLITGLQPGKEVMTRKTLVKNIQKETDAHITLLKNELSKVKYVATTADCWKGFNRSYMGATVHWINADTLERKMAVLACKRMIGRHTHTEIAKVMETINKSLSIHNKIVSTTTDNGSNFVKEFRVFGIDPSAVDVEHQETEEFQFIDVGQALADNGDEHHLIDCSLPPHERCAAHTMNLVATQDSRRAEEDSSLYKRIMRGALARAQAVWNKQSSSTLHADLIKGALGVYLVKPNETRWNSLYDSLTCLVKHFREKRDGLDTCCDGLGLPRFREADVNFIREYCTVMKPIACALDALQAETNAYMGTLLPVLHSLKRRLLAMQEQLEVINICQPLVTALINGLDRRFAEQWFRKDLVIAAVLHPDFQFNWIKDEEKEQIARNWLNVAVQEGTDNSNGGVDTGAHASSENGEEEKESLFDFEKPSVSRNTNRPMWKAEVERYLALPAGGLKCLHSLPILKELFIKYNTSIPSSAAVERIFSTGGLIFTDKRGRLSDENFENLLMLKIGIK